LIITNRLLCGIGERAFQRVAFYLDTVKTFNVPKTMKDIDSFAGIMNFSQIEREEAIAEKVKLDHFATGRPACYGAISSASRGKTLY
jgi:hypothetical protein